MTALDPARIIPVVIDITKTTDTEKAATEAQDITLLINNAGVFKSHNVLTSPQEQLREDMEVNYYGTLNMVRNFAPILEKNNGSVVNIISMVALANAPGLGGYSASKAALYSLTQSLRVDLGKKGINVHGVFPGLIDTDMTKDFDMAKTPPKNVAEAVLAGVEKGDEDIYPDPMAEQLQELRVQDYKAFEKQLGTF